MTLVVNSRSQLRLLLRLLLAVGEKAALEHVEELVAADYTKLDACPSCQQLQAENVELRLRENELEADVIELREQLDSALRKNAAWAEISGARDLAGEEP